MGQYGPYKFGTSLTSLGGKYTFTLHCPRYLSHCLIESLLVQFLSGFAPFCSVWLSLNPHCTTEALRKLW